MGLAGWAQRDHEVLLGKTGGQESQRDATTEAEVRKTETGRRQADGLEEAGGAEAKERGRLETAAEARDPPEGGQPRPHLGFWPLEPRGICVL